MPNENVELEFKGIGSQLKNRLLAVPIYQRPYAWGEEEVSNFWDDVRSAYSSKAGDYFLGTVVLTNPEGGDRDTIIDGQQRLATTAMLLAAIRDVYRQRGDNARADIVQSQYLASADLKSAQHVARLRMSSDDDLLFREMIILSNAGIEALKPSHQKISEAKAFLDKAAGKAADEAGKEWSEKMFGLVEFLANSARVIVLSVPSEADAFLIFETLNDRGADLTIADLLKNYLFGQAKDHIEIVRDGWLQSIGALEIPSENSLFTVFLRHHWSSRHGTVRERDLYKHIRNHVKSEHQAVQFVDELQKGARLYAALLNSDHEQWATLGGDAKVAVETFLRLDLEQVRPLMLAAMQHFKPGELKRLLKALVSWGVRGLVVGGIGGGTYERAYCEAAVKIRKGEIKDANKLFSDLAKIIPTDDEFESTFSVVRVPRNSLARYYLLALENVKLLQKEPELVPNDNADKVNLEHILPKGATDTEWPAFKPEEKRAWLYRLGNVALLPKEPNNKIGNKPFATKKPVLGSSKFQLTKSLATFPDWSPQTIEARQKEMAQIALKAWPRKP